VRRASRNAKRLVSGRNSTVGAILIGMSSTPRACVIAMSILTAFMLQAFHSPAHACPTFIDRSVNCFPAQISDTRVAISALRTEDFSDYEITDSSSIVFAQHPTQPPSTCQLIGTIDKRMDLSPNGDHEAAMAISEYVEYLGANFVVLEETSSTKWSKIFQCLTFQ